MPTRSRSLASPSADAELRLPRPPGVIRRFWARHPVFTDALLAGLCGLFALAPLAAMSAVTATGIADGSVTAFASPFAPAIIAFTGLLAAAAQLIRRRRPLVTFWLAVAAEAAYLATPVAGTTPILMIAAYSVPVYRGSRSGWTAFGAATAVLLGGSALLSLFGAVPLSVSINLGVGALVLMLLGLLVGVNVGNRRRYLEAIIDRSRQLLVERDQQGRLATAAERARIAREMHDIVSHNLTVVVALADGATATADPHRARAATAQIATTARGALAEMRAMLGVLREPGSTAEAPVTPVGAATMADAVEAAQRAGFPVVLRTAGRIDRLPPDARFAVTRIVQESLTNAMRHAPLATRIDVDVALGDLRVEVDVSNDGVRPASDATDHGTAGYGLIGLRERAGHVGGSLTAGRTPDGRWRVHATLPVARQVELVSEDGP